MRSFLVGLVVLVISAPAFGQAAGYVEAIGFGKTYRPYGWTPLLVNLTSTISEPAEYQIQVVQEDLDRDRVTFTRDIVLNPNKQEKFWVYFLAQPRGLGDGSVAELDKLLDVRLCTKGGKPLSELKINDRLENLDPPRGGFGAERGRKLVLFVTDGSGSRSTPALREFENTLGMNEAIAHVPLTPFDLPENALGYDAVDAVVWLDADAGKMTSGGSRRMAALTEWVRSGGRLVVCQPFELFKLEEMLDILPVQGKTPDGDWLIEMRDKKDLSPIRDIASHGSRSPLYQQQERAWDALEARGPFKVAHARLRDDAVLEEWIDWSGGARTDVSPWLARRALGLGSVTWVAQDLGNPALISSAATGWPRVWDKVLGQRNTGMYVDEQTRGDSPSAETAKAIYYANGTVDVGGAFLSGMEHQGRAGGLIFLAGVFFVGYWVVAGPVSYLVLLGKKRTELSWSMFAVAALGATLLTVGVVRLVLRGGAEVHHVSLVRMLPAGKTAEGVPVSQSLVSSRIGLYIPRNNDQTVTLLENDPQGLSYLTPFSVHPAHHAVSSDFPAYLTYTIPVRDNPLSEPVAVGFPYRRTLKKIQARWVGQLSQGIDVSTGAAGTYEQNKARLVPREKGFVSGILVNRTGSDLAHVYFVFNHPSTFEGQAEEDFILYHPLWPDGKPIDLNFEYSRATYLPAVNAGGSQVNRATPGGGNTKSIKALSMSQWTDFWYSGLRATGVSDTFEDARNDFLRSFPIASLYERIPPQTNRANQSDRVEVLRRAAREWDVSELVAAGQLVILAQGGTPGAVGRRPLPIPMDVEGERVTGSGTTFYQFALPLDRGGLTPPWTRLEDLEDAAATATTTTAPPAGGAAAPDVEAADPQVEN